MTRESFTVDTAAGIKLDGRIYTPPIADEHPKDNLAIVLVHPYSVLGGCQALMRGIACELSNKGFTSVTFDMRGVGKSTGRPSLTGFSEVDDVVSVCKCVSQNLSVNRILLVGSSAGNDFLFHLSWVLLLLFCFLLLILVDFDVDFVLSWLLFHCLNLNSEDNIKSKNRMKNFLSEI